MKFNRKTLTDKASKLGFELTRDHSLQQSDDGYYRAHWRLRKLDSDGRPLPYQASSSYFRSLRYVDTALDHVQIMADREF